jgi:glycosyltransferase involved in cell wall biosynthesis
VLSCSPNDPDALACLLSELLTKPELRETLSKKGRERSLYFHWDLSAKRIIDILERTALAAQQKKEI